MIRYADLGEAALLEYMVAELAALEHAMTFAASPAALLELAGLVQLALRHPHVPARLHRSGAEFLDQIRDGFADAPAILEVLRRGDDPTTRHAVTADVMETP